MSVIAAAITGLGGLATSMINRNSQRKENQKNRDFQREMWNANNEYNTPTNQMARLQEAGINPHLAYANGQPMKTTKYLPTDIVSYDENKKQFIVSIPDNDPEEEPKSFSESEETASPSEENNMEASNINHDVEETEDVPTDAPIFE